MNRDRERLTNVAGRLAMVGGGLGIVAGVVQVTIGSRIPEWSGNKDRPVALGLLTVALAVSVVVAARALPAATPASGDAMLPVTALWFAVVAGVCVTTVGRLWALPGVLLLTAAGVTLAACGWPAFRTAIAGNWLRGLLGLLGACELLMAVSAAPAITVAAGLVAAGGLVAAAVEAGSVRRPMAAALIVATVPFAVLTWWTVVTPLVSVAALVIGLTAAGGGRPERAQVPPAC